MEQVFFRLHVRFVTTVTRLLSPKTRRVLEYVTLANASCLVLSLAWLHTRFVNPKGQRSAVSCLPAALERAGVDPAQLHVLQIHIRMPPDDRGGGDGGSGGSSERRKNLFGGQPCGDEPGLSISAALPPDPDGQVNAQEGGWVGEGREGGGGGRGGERGMGGDFSCAAGAVAGGGAGGGLGGVAGGGGNGRSASVGGSALPSESLPPEVFYSMKLVTGKDAVGTMSGPGTLGIELCGKGEGGEGAEGGGGGGLVCGASGEDKRSRVQTLVDALPWGKGESGKGAGSGRDPGPASARGDSGRRGERDGVGERLDSWASPPPRGALDESATTVQAGWVGAGAGEAASGKQDPRQQQQQQWREGGAQEDEGGRGWGRRLQDEVYLYSLEKGFLMLRPDLRRKHGIITANVTVSVYDPCLGGTVIQALVKEFVGYDTVVMNWLISLYGGRGFLYGVHNNELFNLNYAAEFIESTEDLGKFVVFKVGVMFTTLFLFFTTTTLVSFTLRETQERMLKFTFLLQHHVRHGLPYAPLIFTHVVESLVFVPIMVGILFFLFEFFSDQLLAFMVLSVVWLCEVYSVVSVRTYMCIRFFPQVFFLYFTLFHVYFFSFPFGFSYLALVTTVLFLQHSMLFFWNRYEVPALTAGVVSSRRPRQAGMVIGVVPRYDPHGMGMPAVRPDVAPDGRRRAVSISTVQARESTPALTNARRIIPRSNSSPDPTSSPALGRSERVTAPTAALSRPSPAAPTVPPAEFTARPSRGSSPARGRRPASDWSPARGWGGGGGGGGGVAHGAGADNASSASDDPRTLPRNVSAPLLGSFPFSMRDLVQNPLFRRTAGPARTPADVTAWRDADGGGATIAGANAGAGPGRSLGAERGRPGVGARNEARAAAKARAGAGVRAGVRTGARDGAGADARADARAGAGAGVRAGTGAGIAGEGWVAGRAAVAASLSLSARELDKNGRDTVLAGAAVAPGLRPGAAAAAPGRLAPPARIMMRPAVTANPPGPTRAVPVPGVGYEGRSLHQSGDALATAAAKEAFGVAVLGGGNEKRESDGGGGGGSAGGGGDSGGGGSDGVGDGAEWQGVVGGGGGNYGNGGGGGGSGGGGWGARESDFSIPPPLGRADDAGRVFGSGDGQRLQECLQERELLRRDHRLGLGGTQHRSMYEDEDGDSNGRLSPQSPLGER